MQDFTLTPAKVAQALNKIFSWEWDQNILVVLVILVLQLSSTSSRIRHHPLEGEILGSSRDPGSFALVAGIQF
jgi:hypothetical protein